METLEFFGQSAMYKLADFVLKEPSAVTFLLSLNSYDRLGASNNQIDGFGHGVTDASLYYSSGEMKFSLSI